MVTTSKTNPTMEELLASQNKKIVSLQRGQPVEGEIVSLSDKEIILDLQTKSEGILISRDISKDQLDLLKIGDKLKAFVVLPENESGQTVLSLTQPVASRTGPKGRGINWTRFVQAQAQKSKLLGKVLEINKGGLIVEVEGSRGFLPNSQVGFELLSKLNLGMEDLIGQNITVTVSEIDQTENRLIFSQRGQVSDEVKNKLKEFKKDQTVSGKIVAVLPFGLVVNVGGSEGLVFIADVAWEKVEDLGKIYKNGDEIQVKVLGLDEDLGRLNLSIKELTTDPFSEIAQNYPADEVVKGEVISQSEGGVVFKFKDGVEGFLPSSKMEPAVNYEIGKSMQMLVDSVDVKRRRINLAPFVTSTAGLIYK